MSVLKLCFQVAHEDGCLVPVSSVFWRRAVCWTPCLEQDWPGQPGSTPPSPSDH